MKKLILGLISLPILCISQQTYVPDNNFEQALINLGYDNVLDDSVITANIDTITALHITSLSIADLTGIQDFTDLIVLNCSYNLLSNLDVTQNLALKELYCIDNQLTILDVTKNIALTYLRCRENQLTILDVSQNTALILLDCFSNQLSSLDISQNTALVIVFCLDNQLSNLDITQNLVLEELFCQNNQLTSLDVTRNTLLTQLDCSYNQLTSLDVTQNTALSEFHCRNNLLSELDVTQNNDVIEFDCQGNQLSCLNIKNGNNANMNNFNAILNSNLTCIEVDNVAWCTANWINIDAQTSFSTNCNNLCTLTSIKENTINTSIFPNPTNDLVNLEIEGFNSLFEVEIYELQGRLLETTKSKTVSLKKYSKGIYIFRVSYGDITEEVRVLRD
jgi:hypothetical protein